MGICNIIAKTFNIFAPFVAETAAPIPMIFLSVLSGFAAAFAYLLNNQVTMSEEPEEIVIKSAADPINDNEEDNLLQT